MIVDSHTEESEKQRQPPLQAIIEIAGGPISWEHLSRMVATVVRETLCQERTSPVDEEEEIAPVDIALALEPTTQNSRGATSTCHMKKRMTSP